MRIEAIDVFWVNVPLAFVWRTSYADQDCTDTILVRMQGEEHEAWGERCPVYVRPTPPSTPSREIQALCAEHGVPCWVGGMLETAVGGAICAELATLPNFTYPANIFPSSYFYANDLGKREIVLSGAGEVATSTCRASRRSPIRTCSGAGRRRTPPSGPSAGRPRPGPARTVPRLVVRSRPP